jgi:ribosomal protein S18 acetylase RimI-like enzyme
VAPRVMSVEAAQPADAFDAFRTIALCTDMLQRHGIDQWDDVYPSLGVVQQDARVGSLFVIRDELMCIGSVCVNDEQDSEWGTVDWKYVAGPFLCVHRLSVHPAWQNRGLGRQMMDFAEAAARDRGCQSIRLDAYTANAPVVSFYAKRGYERVGEVWFPRRSAAFVCLEKLVR